MKSLDYSFFKRNFSNINSLFDRYLYLLFAVILVAIVNTFIMFFILKKTTFKRRKFLILLVILILSVYVFRLKNELFVFASSVYNEDDVINNYEKNIRKKMIDESIDYKDNFFSDSANPINRKTTKNLENIIFLQIESLNSFLVSTSTTPNFLSIAKEGAFFPAFYGNGIQTILGQENILCSIPPSFDYNLVKSGYDKNVFCLPYFFSEIGYKTFFLKTFNLDFDKTGEFMKNIGFQEVHASDIMSKNDPVYYWGYKEDVFYKRAFGYLKNNISNKNFIYLEVGPTNHWPFNTPEDFKGKLPFNNPLNHRQRLINTTYIQDSYLATARKEIDILFPEKNYTLFILGDHSWPAELHEGNYFNEKKAYEENFLTSMAVVSGDGSIPSNVVVNKKYSQMDIMPTITEFYGYELKNNYRSSFGKELKGEVNDEFENEILLIQPYGEQYLNIVREGRYKEQYNATTKTTHIFDLFLDPMEKIQ